MAKPTFTPSDKVESGATVEAQHIKNLEEAVKTIIAYLPEEFLTEITWAKVTGKPATFAPEIGTTAAKAAAGNHDHAVKAHSASGLAAASTVQAAFEALSTRVNALETKGE